MDECHKGASWLKQFQLSSHLRHDEAPQWIKVKSNEATNVLSLSKCGATQEERDNHNGEQVVGNSLQAKDFKQ